MSEQMPRIWWSPSRGWFGEVGRETFVLVPDYDGPGELPEDARQLTVAAEETGTAACVRCGKAIEVGQETQRVAASEGYGVDAVRHSGPVCPARLRSAGDGAADVAFRIEKLRAALRDIEHHSEDTQSYRTAGEALASDEQLYGDTARLRAQAPTEDEG